MSLKPGDVLTFMPDCVKHANSREMTCVVVRARRCQQLEVLDVLMLEDTLEDTDHAFPPGSVVNWPRHYLEGTDWAKLT